MTARGADKREWTEEQVRDLLRAAIERWSTQKAFAEHHGLSPQYITDVMKGRREPAARICQIVGIERTVVYRGSKK